MRLARVALAATVLSLTLAGCTSSDDGPTAINSSTTSGPDPSQSSEPTGPGTASGGTSGSPPSGGTAGSPAAVTATTHLFEWTGVDAGADDIVTQGEVATLTLDRSQTSVTIGRPGDSHRVTAPRRFQFNDVITDGTWAVLVAQDKQEVKPGRATVIELASGSRTLLDGGSDVPTVNGGSWAIGDGVVHHATYDRSGRYCLAAVDLASTTSTVGYCAPKRSGFSNVLTTPSATSLLTFGGQPQCRTVARLEGAAAVPLEGVAPCKGWDGAVTPSGAIWSVVRNESRVEQGRFYASADGGYFDLGVGNTGSLTWCGDSAYFVRDAQKDVDKARLLRWTPDAGLEVVYESPGQGSAFLFEPRCSGHLLTVSAFGEGGDEQVWAKVP